MRQPFFWFGSVCGVHFEKTLVFVPRKEGLSLEVTNEHGSLNVNENPLFWKVNKEFFGVLSLFCKICGYLLCKSGLIRPSFWVKVIIPYSWSKVVV